MPTSPATGFNYPDTLAAFGSVPTTLTPVTTATVQMLSGWFSNPSGNDITLTVTDTAGQKIVPDVVIPSPGTYDFETKLGVPFTGVKWQSNGVAGLLGGLGGYIQ
jgi:hypothetical protein